MNQNKDEKFYKNICIEYIETMSKEMLLEKNNEILHIFIEDEYIELKENGKITVDNYIDYLDSNFQVYNYCFYKELFDEVIKDEIAYDLNDLELFNENNEWDFYISFEELKAIGYGFMVKDNYPLIEEYALPDEKIFEFFDYFSLEQLEDFEQSLNLYFVTHDIYYNQKDNTLESRENITFNSDIIRLACGLITYDDFIEDYKEDLNLSSYDKTLSKVIEYFKQNGIKNLMDYGNDNDEGLFHLSSMYKELMAQLGIEYKNIYTKDVSDGKYLTTIIFNDNSKIELDTSAWNGIKVVTENMQSVYETYELYKENELEKDISYC